ncbi:hypothetical protein ENSA5_44880 [Enhygromyxa salina]|uniref:Uncharacterized protein n=1 Tax=Enhygromyxa salina TaxID=215803 RepID=A0A2S9XJT6_9BACT|nr:hypothetical protein [Enhygromyxa salina]PRP93149.1 hypothetical protein ENSA5_44880 [Enhygromyxa salina]
MRPLDLQAERFTATGNIASEGMRNQLGRPRLDRIAVLIREAAQNAWDAKQQDAQTVTFGASCYAFDDDKLRALREQVFADTPTNPSQELASLLAASSSGSHESEALRALVLYDRGTTGLGGPTRADSPACPGEVRDFVDFLRNVGQPPDKSRGGGTFGYGKAALYLSSRVDTILVHTRCRVGGRLQSRFMVSALTPHYEVEGTSYTGRHWWGRREPDGVVDPLLGREADKLAQRLGMPIAPAGELGTTILLLAPRLGGRTPAQAMAYIQAQMLWNFWPKMIPWEDEEAPRMRFETLLDGEQLSIPSPAKVHPLNGFVKALQTVRQAERGGRGQDASDVTTLLCGKPKQTLGLLSLQRIVYKERPETDYGEVTELPEFMDRCHHVALLRRAELVITYHPGPPIPNNYVEYVGVFLANDEMDRVYAASEPPTHDEWRPENLADRRAKTFVRTTFRRIDARTREFVAPASTSYAADEDRPLAALSKHLGPLLVDAGGPTGPRVWPASQTQPENPSNSTGATGEQDPPKRIRRQARPKIILEPEVTLLDEQGTLVRLFRAELTHPKDGRRTKLCARAFTMIVGGAEERDAPEGADQPRVTRWRGPTGHTHERASSVIAGEDEEGVWEIRVEGGAECVVGLELNAEAVRR